MSILINKHTKILVQGITGKSGRMQTGLMIESGSQVVAGVTPGKGGQVVHGVPVYNTVSEARARHDFDTVVCLAPPRAAMNCCFEAADAGAELFVLCTEQIPTHDVVKILSYARRKGMTVIGPGCSGVIAPGVCKAGSHPVRFFARGYAGVVSKSGALSYEAGKTLTDAGIGQSTVVGIGGGPIWGFSQKDAIEQYEKDAETGVIVLLGEIGGSLEEDAADYIRQHVTKPVVALIVGRSAPRGKSLGHAGAIISGGFGTAESKIAALKGAGVTVVKNPAELADAVRAAYEKTKEA